MSPATDQELARVIGRYILFGEIAAGGMATVHFGRLSGPVGFSRTVAIKRLHAQFAKDPEFVTMFLDEARLAGRIRHPNVVPTLDVVATEGEMFLVMDYVQGESLSRLLRALRARGTRIPPDIAVTILASSLHGLHAAHEARDEHGQPLEIVHRDVSPQNILVGTDGVARVLDFGVAKAAGRLQTTREGQIKGKINYMAPEQIHGGRVTRQTDIYATGVVLWETLTGQRLYEGDNEAMVLVKVLEGRATPPSSIVPELSPAFDQIFARAVSRDPAQRFATAREMAIALEKSWRMASPSEVGEWVEQVAGDELHRRATRIAEIESISSTAGMTKEAAALVDRIQSGAHAAADTRVTRVSGVGQRAEPESQLSSISVSRSGEAPPPQKRPSRIGIVLAAGLFVGVLGGVLFVAMRTPKASATATSPRQVETPRATPEPPTASAVTPQVILTAVPEPPPSVAPHAVDAGAPRASNPPAVRTPPPVRSPPVVAAPKVNCDPPFTIDAAGHKIYKMECVKR